MTRFSRINRVFTQSIEVFLQHFLPSPAGTQRNVSHSLTAKVILDENLPAALRRLRPGRLSKRFQGMPPSIVLTHMTIIKPAYFVAACLLSGFGPAFGGQAYVAPSKDFIDRAALVVVVDVKKVTEITVSTGDDQTSIVYVAEAEVIQTIKSDHNPTPDKRRIAIIGSTIPRSSAVWAPIEKGRYLAFLNPEQGHYRYSEKYDMRAVRKDGTVEWIEKNAAGDYELSNLSLEEAIKKIQSEPVDAGNREQPGE